MTKIQYIIDHPGYGDKFSVTTTHNGVEHKCGKKQVMLYVACYDCFVSARADVQMRAVPQDEVIAGTTAALNALSVGA